MTLTALLSAQIPAQDGGGEGLAALLPLAGLTLLERQAEDAAAIGAGQILVLVDAVPAELAAAVDRIRARGLAVSIVRDGAAVMTAAQGAQRLLLVADGLVAPRGLWEALAGAPAPRLLSVGDTPATAALERIDAQRRWAGLAMVDASAVAALAALPDDWDPQLALLRGAIQAEAPAIPCEPQLFERGDVALLDRAIAADLVEQRLLAKGTDAVVGLVHANLAMPLARAGARWLLRGQQGGLAARLVSLFGAIGAVGAMMLGHPMLAVFAALIGLLGRAAGATIGAFRPEAGAARVLAGLGDVAFAGALMAATWAAADYARMAVMLWLSLGLSLVLLIQLGRRLADRGVARPALVWDDGASWLLIGFGTLGGAWSLAFAVAVPLAAASILLAVWKHDGANAV